MGTLVLRRAGARFFAATIMTAALAACGGADAPTVISFTATPLSVTAGSRSTLAWEVQDAVTIAISNATSGEVLVQDAQASGSIMTGLLNETTSFVLKATNDGGDTFRNVTVTISTVGGPQVVSFTATPSTIDAGADAVLAWQTTEATEVEVTAGAVSVVSAGAPEGMVTVNPTVTTTYTLTAKGAEGANATGMVTVVVNPADPMPTVRAFTANPNPVNAGGSSTLSWDVADAATIVVTDAASTEVYNGADGMGSVTVSPSATTLYTLVATNPQGSAMSTVTVNVNPPQGAQISAFTANPTSILFGQVSTLSWTATNATRVEIAAGGNVLVNSTNLTGTATVSPTATTEYVLTAFNPAGDATANVTVTVSATAPVISDFSASPNPVALTSSTTLSWTTLGAATIQITRGGTVELDTTLASGTLVVPITGPSETFTLTATNPTGGNSATVTVYGHAAPVIHSFTAAPSVFQGTVTATLSWDVSSVQTLELFEGSVAVPGFAGVSTSTGTVNSVSSFSLSLSATATYRLVATSLAGSVEATVTLVQQVVEAEPNNDAGTAQVVLVSGGSNTGDINPGDDEDWYAVTVPAGGWVRAETDDGAGGCPFDTNLTLTSTDGVTQLVFDDDDGTGTCSLIDPNRDAAARNLPAGTYYVSVGSYQANTGTYVASLAFGGPACGNTIPETGEQCDDGNLAAGDGCDAACLVEPTGVYSAPGAPLTISEAISPIGEQDLYRIDVTAEAYLDVETFQSAAAGTCGFDTVLRLFDSNFVQLGTDDEGGVGSCSHIDPNLDAFALLAPGTYWVQVEDYLNNGLIPAYEVVFSSIAANVCGNGIIEGTEACDDGNTNPADSCNNTCQFTGTLENEAGGNNAFNGAGVVVVAVDSVLAGDLTPAGDADWWAVTVPQGYSIDAYLTVNSLTSCPVSPEGRLQLYAPDGTTLLASNDNSGPDGNCGRVYPGNDPDTLSMTAGTYYLRATEDTTTPVAIAQYFLHLSLIAPGCGNNIVEATEACDDGNVVGGDGCSATCGFEAFATYTSPGALTFFQGSISPATNVDAIQITVTTPSYIYAETFTSTTPTFACNVDTRLTLFQADGITEIGTDDFDGISSCSLIEPNVDAFAQLAAGTYWLTIEEDGNDLTIANYQVAVWGVPVGVCGNLVVEGAEQCDDGNSVAGDGCDATCQVEPVGIYTAPGGPQVFAMQAIDPIGEQDVYRIDVTSTTYIVAETFVDAVAGTCPFGTDTVITLFDSLGAQLGTDDEGGINSCSRIDPAADPFARLAPGTYFLRVEDYLNDGLIPRYDMAFSTVPADVCGNGVVEAAVMEGCDDGNTTAGDGCDALCQFEGTVIPEVEPNNDRATATPSTLVAVGTVTTQGAVDVASDLDYWAFTVPAGGASITAITYTSPGNTATCASGTDTRIYLEDAAGVELGNNDDGNPAGTGLCSLYPVTALAAGTYYLRVQYWNGAAPSPQPYFMDITLQ